MVKCRCAKLLIKLNKSSFRNGFGKSSLLALGCEACFQALLGYYFQWNSDFKVFSVIARDAASVFEHGLRVRGRKIAGKFPRRPPTTTMEEFGW